MEDKYIKLLKSHNWMLRTGDDEIVSNKWVDIKYTDEIFFGINDEYNQHGVFAVKNTLALCETGKWTSCCFNKSMCTSKYKVVAINEEIPLEFIRMCRYKTAEEGETITPHNGQRWIITCDCTIKNQTGGDVYIYAGEQKVIEQQGGEWHACARSKQTIINQNGGEWSAFDESEQMVYGQGVAKWEAWDNSKQIVSNQKYGTWIAHENSQQIVKK